MRQYQRSKPARRSSHRLVQFIWKEINEQGWSQEDVAERAGVASSTMRKWRTGARRSPSLRDLEAVLQTLGYDLEIRPRP